MSTRGIIGIKRSNGIVDSVFLQHSSMLSNTGKVLLKHYNSKELADQIITLGSIFILAPRIAPDKELDLSAKYDVTTGRYSNKKIKHTLETPQRNITVAYHRDDPEYHINLVKFNDFTEKEFWKENLGQDDLENIYLFKDGNWYISSNDRKCFDVLVSEEIKKLVL